MSLCVNGIHVMVIANRSLFVKYWTAHHH